MRTGNTNVTVEIACEPHNLRLDKSHFITGGYSTSIGFLKPLSLQQAGAIDSEGAAIDSEDAAIDSEDAAIACFRDVIVK